MTTDTPTPPAREKFSEDGRYKLVIHSIPTQPGCWNYLSVDVFRTQDNALIGTTTRNYGNYGIFSFVQQDGVDYLILSENYHGGYGVMNLHTGEKAIFDPSINSTNPRQQYWCWANVVQHDPEARELVVEGCYWAAGYDRITFDFSDPMKVPYAELKVEYDFEYEDEEMDEEMDETQDQDDNQAPLPSA